MGENFANHINGKELIPRIYTNQNKTPNKQSYSEMCKGLK